MPVKMARLEASASSLSSPLHQTAQHCDVPALKRILSARAQTPGLVNSRDLDGLTAMYHVIHAADRYPEAAGEAVGVLCAAGANVNELFERQEPLRPSYLFMVMMSAYSSNKFLFNVMRTLLDAGADPNASNAKGRTPLYMACYYKRLDLVDLLLQYGADVNERDCCGCCPLHAAVQSFNPFDRRFAGLNDSGPITTDCIVERLIHHGAQVNAKDHAGNLPLHLAITNNKRRYMDRQCRDISLLLQHGSDIHAKCGIGEGSQFNTGEGSQFNTLQLAAQNGKYLTVMHCLENHMDPNAYGVLEASPLNLAVRGNHPQATRCLLKYGAALNKTEGESSVLLTAAFEGFPEMVQLLLDYGANPHLGFPLQWIQNPLDRIPLLSPGHVKSVKMLVAQGASLHVGNGAPGTESRGAAVNDVTSGLKGDSLKQSSGIQTLLFLLKSEDGHREHRGRINTLFHNPFLQTAFANEIFLHLVRENAIRVTPHMRSELVFHLEARHVKHFLKTTCPEKLYLLCLAGFRVKLFATMLKCGDCMRDKLSGKWRDVYSQLQTPLTLRAHSRIAIRQAITVAPPSGGENVYQGRRPQPLHFTEAVRTLPLPKCLQEFVLMSDVL